VVPDNPRRTEITGCDMLAEFRARSLYAFAICSQPGGAAGLGISQIYMKTNWENKPSPRGIRKAELNSTGFTLLMTPPILTGRTWVLSLFR